jgi:hypothetical protein
MRFGRGGLVGLDFQPEAGVESWQNHMKAGRSPGEGFVASLAYLWRLNVAHNYINALRKFSNDPAWVARMAAFERRLMGGGPAVADQRAISRLQAADSLMERQVVPLPLLGAMRDELMHQTSYHDPAIPGWTYRGRVEAAPYPALYMESYALFASDSFFRLCANPAIMRLCREALGPRVALSWGWAWLNNPGYLESPKWKWHRNNGEPFNALMILIPLDAVTSSEDGPFMLIPGSSRLRDFYEPRLYGEEELAGLVAHQGAAMMLAELGDVAFINPFALHRMLPPHRRQRMVMLLASIAPSHRSPAICRRTLDELPGDLRQVVADNRRFFHRLVR